MKASKIKFLTTGIGSLPHHSVDSALNYAFAHDLPFLPQLPVKNKNEFMIPQSLWTLPGLTISDEGEYQIDLKAWLKMRLSYQGKIDKALRTKDYSDFLFPAKIWNALGPFLFEVEEKEIKKVKLQITGPITAQMVVKLTDGDSLRDYPDILSQIYQTIFLNALALTDFFQKKGCEVILFLDEPALYFLNANILNRDIALHLKVNELNLMITALKQNNVEVGVHCCSDTYWPVLMGLPIDYLSFDFFLSSKTILHYSDDLKQFVKKGGKLALGVIPSLASENVSASKVTDEIKKFLSDEALKKLSSPVLLTAACGLGLESIENAEKTLGLLKGTSTHLV